MAQRRIAGLTSLYLNGRQVPCRGSVTYGGLKNMREGIAGVDAVHGYKEVPQVPYVECEISTTADTRVEDVVSFTGGTVTAVLANGRQIVLNEAWYAGEGETDAEEGALSARFEGMSGQEV